MSTFAFRNPLHSNSDAHTSAAHNQPPEVRPAGSSRVSMPRGSTAHNQPPEVRSAGSLPVSMPRGSTAHKQPPEVRPAGSLRVSMPRRDVQQEERTTINERSSSTRRSAAKNRGEASTRARARFLEIGGTTHGGTCVVRFVARVRARVRRGHERTAKKIGVLLCVCSLGNLGVSIVVAVTNEQRGALLQDLSANVSLVALLMHAGLILGHMQSPIFWIHYWMYACDSLVFGTMYAMRRDIASTTYQAAWAFVFMPLGACATQQFLEFVRRLPASAKDRVAKAGVSAFTGALGMVAYICLSGLSCLWYVDNSRDYCSTRVYVCGTEMLFLGTSAILAIFLSVQPVSLKQATFLHVSPSQMVGFCSYACLLLLSLAMYSQNERFAPRTPLMVLIARASSVCVLTLVVAFTYSIVKSDEPSTAAAGQAPSSGGNDVAVTKNTGDDTDATSESVWGTLVPYRCVLVFVTLLYIATIVFLPPRVSESLAPLSLIAAVFHLFLSIEYGARSAGIHYIIHSCVSPPVIVGRFYSRDGVSIAGKEGLKMICMVWGMKVLFVVRRSMKTHGRDACAACAIRFFCALSFLVPGALYLTSDTLGCLLQKPFDEEAHEFDCGYRADANYCGAIHVGGVTLFGLLLSDSTFGLRLDLYAIMNLRDITVPERTCAFFLGCATTIVLILYASREAQGNDQQIFRAAMRYAFVM